MAAKIVIRVAVAVGLIAGLAFVARAETPPPPDEGGRYLLRKAQDGWFRIDQKTGQASVCALGPAGYVCELVPDDRDALLDEITRLAEENAMLRAQLARADLPPRDLPGEPQCPQYPRCPRRGRGEER